MKKLTAIVLLFSLLLTACGSSSNVTDLMEDVPARVVCLAEEPDCGAEAADFAVRLLQNSISEENTLLSPLSVLSALAMTANGAKGETLAQMEQTLGMSTANMNSYLYSILDRQDKTLKLANSIWFTDDDTFTVAPDFLETNANYYQADIFQTTFDQAACDAINDWVSKKTDGMIPKILDEIPEVAVMYLVNALSFEGEWTETYKENQVHEDTFTKEDGTEQTVEMMRSSEQHYLEDEMATGFVKYYKGGNYAFAALLPNEGVTVAEYAATLTGEHLQALLAQPEEVKVYARIPKFEAEYDTELSEVLTAMGMEDAFDDEKADFSGLGTSEKGNICISRVLHKTFISVAEQGTKAGASTVVEMVMATGAPVEDSRYVTLDRPFVYMILDRETNLPLFIGTLMDVQ